MKTDNIKISPQWRKSKEEIWDEIFSGLEEAESQPGEKHISLWRYVAAAVVAIILVSVAFARFYTITETAVRGSHLAVTLPDGSRVMLNAGSIIEYKPLWWAFSRSVTLNGEAYFEVKAGSRFAVGSDNGRVGVLGTSFNVFARAAKYSVTCLTGKVEVTVNDKRMVLTPNMQLTLQNGKLLVMENANAEQSIGWTQNKFNYVAASLFDVIEEIERQYDIRIITTDSLNHLYTGYFSKSMQAEDVLEVIGKPFGIRFKIKQ